MSDAAKVSRAPPATGETGAALLAASGFAAAFGAASCYALPVLLGSLGLGSAWLFGVALLAGPHRNVLLITGIACLVGAAVLLARRWRVGAACAPGAARSPNLVLRYLTGVGLVLGFALLALTYFDV